MHFFINQMNSSFRVANREMLLLGLADRFGQMAGFRGKKEKKKKPRFGLCLDT
jgi:hypothetical protein